MIIQWHSLVVVKFLLLFIIVLTAHRGEAIVGTVSGTSISFGSVTTVTSNEMYDMTVVYDANAGKVVVAYKDGSDSNKGKARVGTVDGSDNISFGTEVTFANATTQACSGVYDSSNQKVAYCL